MNPTGRRSGQNDRMGGPVPQVLRADMGKVEVQARGRLGSSGVGVTQAEERAVVQPTTRSDQGNRRAFDLFPFLRYETEMMCLDVCVSADVIWSPGL